jgi:hypothetical protein
LEDFKQGRPVAASSPRVQFDKDVGLPEVGMYVSVWEVMPLPDPDLEQHGIFVGYALIDAVNAGEATNCILQPLDELRDGLYPFMPGTVRRYHEKSGYPIGAVAKGCRGYGPHARCDRPVTRVTEHYGDMSCHRCYPDAKINEQEMLDTYDSYRGGDHY